MDRSSRLKWFLSLLASPSHRELGKPAIGHELARLLDVRQGDLVALSVADSTGGRIAPRTERFTVARIFRTNFSEYDTEWVFMDRGELRRLSRLPGQANVIEIRLDSTRDTESATAAIGATAGNAYSVSDWRSMNGGLFSALAIQQTTLFLVIGLNLTGELPKAFVLL